MDLDETLEVIEIRAWNELCHDPLDVCLVEKLVTESLPFDVGDPGIRLEPRAHVCDVSKRARGGKSETFAGLAGAGDLVASVVAADSRTRRAGELLAQGVATAEISTTVGQAAEAVESVPLLANLARDARLDAPALDRLTALIEGRLDPERWTATVVEPARRQPSRTSQAA